jgi:hypothetical protein
VSAMKKTDYEIVGDLLRMIPMKYRVGVMNEAVKRFAARDRRFNEYKFRKRVGNGDNS